jgi:hypothetical protein
LSDYPLAALLLSAQSRASTGVLRLEHPSGTSRLYLRQGAPAGAHMAIGYKPLGQVLVEQGLIGLEALDRALPELERGRLLQEVLREQGSLDDEGLREGLRLQLLEHVRALADLSEGAFELRQEEPPKWTEGLAADPEACIAEAMSAPRADAWVLEILADLGPKMLRLAEPFERLVPVLKITPAELEALKAWGEGAGPEELVSRGIEPRRARWLAAALVALGGAVAIDPREEARERAESLARARLEEARRAAEEQARKIEEEARREQEAEARRQDGLRARLEEQDRLRADAEHARQAAADASRKA